MLHGHDTLLLKQAASCFAKLARAMEDTNYALAASYARAWLACQTAIIEYRDSFVELSASRSVADTYLDEMRFEGDYILRLLEKVEK